MYRFTYSREEFENNGIDKTKLETLIDKHISICEKMSRNESYYLGEHDICDRVKKSSKQANNKIVCNHARYISDVATGYFLGNPIRYTIDEGDIDVLTDVFDMADADSADMENALNMSIYGLAYELIYADENSDVKIKALDPKHCFIVVDESIEERELFAVYYYIEKDDVRQKTRKIARVFTESEQRIFVFEGEIKTESVESGHYFGGIPVVEYLNNAKGIGDFEQQISLIDAYNTLASDRVNDKEQFLDSLLIVYGATLSEDAEGNDEARKRLKESKILEMPDGSRAEYLVNTFDENSVEVLRKAIEEDIHKFSFVPCITDDNFAGNASGVAMEYKLLGLDMITKIKTANYRKGLKKRLKLLCNFLGKKAVNIDSESIMPQFTRGLPKNVTEIAQTVSSLDGIVSRETLLSQIPFVEDALVEIEKVKEESGGLHSPRDNEPPEEEPLDEGDRDAEE